MGPKNEVLIEGQTSPRDHLRSIERIKLCRHALWKASATLWASITSRFTLFIELWNAGRPEHYGAQRRGCRNTKMRNITHCVAYLGRRAIAKFKIAKINILFHWNCVYGCNEKPKIYIIRYVEYTNWKSMKQKLYRHELELFSIYRWRSALQGHRCTPATKCVVKQWLPTPGAEANH